jgi:acetyl-CoA carboxylase biotin carboxyl carrier protein
MTKAGKETQVTQDVDSELIRKLAGLLEETGLGEIEYATNDWKIRIARPAPAPAASSVIAAPPIVQPNAESRPVADTPGSLKSPMVGTAYLTPDPQSPAFVSVGSRISEGDTVMIIEAMKVMNAIPAHQSGTIKEILVTGGQPIEFGQILMVIE